MSAVDTGIENGTQAPMQLDSNGNLKSLAQSLLDVQTINGQAFTHSGPATVAQGASYDHLLITAASPKKVWLSAFTAEISSGPFYFFLYEGATVSDNGTLKQAYNRNRNFPDTYSSAVYEQPTVTGTGTQIRYSFAPGSNNTGNIVNDPQGFMVLKPSTNYLIRATNGNGNNVTYSFTMRFIEF